MSKTAEQIAKITEQQKQLENRKKELLSRQREEERKKRTKRLIERGAILESLIDNAETFTNEQIQAFLVDTITTEFAREKLRRIKSETTESVQSLKI